MENDYIYDILPEPEPEGFLEGTGDIWTNKLVCAFIELTSSDTPNKKLKFNDFFSYFYS